MKPKPLIEESIDAGLFGSASALRWAVAALLPTELVL